jgi:hypothetical protein
MAMMRYPQMGHAFGRKEGLTGPFVVAAESEEMQVIIIFPIIIIMSCNIAVDFSQGEEEWSSTWKKKMKKREC